jgi:hypothetical protein
MQSIHADTLRSAIDSAAIYDVTVLPYAGRGMDPDAECAAVRFGDLSELLLLLVALVGELSEDEAQYLAKRTRTDSLGHGSVAYWPGVRLDGEPD